MKRAKHGKYRAQAEELARHLQKYLDPKYVPRNWPHWLPLARYAAPITFTLVSALLLLLLCYRPHYRKASTYPVDAHHGWRSSWFGTEEPEGVLQFQRSAALLRPAVQSGDVEPLEGVEVSELLGSCCHGLDPITEATVRGARANRERASHLQARVIRTGAALPSDAGNARVRGEAFREQGSGWQGGGTGRARSAEGSPGGGAEPAGDGGLSEMIEAASMMHSTSTHHEDIVRTPHTSTAAPPIEEDSSSRPALPGGRESREDDGPSPARDPWLVRPGGQEVKGLEGPVVITRKAMEKRGALYMPKVDTQEERIWPHPNIRLRDGPWTPQWEAARGDTWRRFLNLLPDRDPVRRKRYDSCAVVGNGGTLLVYEHGAAIDGHDAVIRFNRGTTAGFHRHVGNRTTIRIVNRNHLGHLEPSDELVLQQVTAPEALTAFVDFKHRLKKHKLDAKGQGMGEVAVYAVSPELHSRVLREYSEHLRLATTAGLEADTPATNGFYGVVLALQLCRKVSIYGFSRKWTPNAERGTAEAPFVPYHYFDDQEPVGQQTARDNDELRGLEHLAEEHPEQLRFGEPCQGACRFGACAMCPPGSQCACGRWHPVPLPGFCYRRAQRGEVACFHRCRDQAKCAGGYDGECRQEDGATEERCHSSA